MNIIEKVFCKDVSGIINSYIMISEREVMLNKMLVCSEIKLVFKKFGCSCLFKILFRNSKKREASILDFINLVSEKTLNYNNIFAN
jgi:hypothetical protein